MVLTILYILLGLGLIVFGADFLVDGASAIARKAGISDFVIGLTIVGFGTSCPELVVSVTGALEGNADIALGNVVGSNIFNTLLILGLTAMLRPMPITRSNVSRDIPMTIAATILLAGFGFSHSLLNIGQSDMLSRAEGILFLVVFAAYMFLCFKSNDGTAEGHDENGDNMGLLKAVILVAGGLAALIFGGKLFVDSATDFAHALGVSDKFIAITLLAGGTSLPELATCVMAALKGKGQMALGDILGSNVFNILLILGLASTITPLSCAGMSMVDLGVLLLSVLLLFIAAFTGKRNILDRFDASLLLLCEAGYLTYLFLTA